MLNLILMILSFHTDRSWLKEQTQIRSALFAVLHSSEALPYFREIIDGIEKYRKGLGLVRPIFDLKFLEITYWKAETRKTENMSLCWVKISHYWFLSWLNYFDLFTLNSIYGTEMS